MTREKPIELTFLVLDVFVIVASLWLGAVLREPIASVAPGLKPAVAWQEYVHLLLVFLPAWALFAERLDLCRTRLLAGSAVGLFRALVWTQVWGLVVIALILVGAQVPVNRSLIVAFMVLSTLLLVISKGLQRAWVLRHHGRAVALVLAPLSLERVADLDAVQGRELELLDTEGPDALTRRLEQGSVDEVVLSGAVSKEVLSALLEACERVGVPALVTTEIPDVGMLRTPRAETVGKVLYLRYEPYEPDVPARFLKEAFDRVVGLFALLVAAPLMVLLAIAVRIFPPGPVFFVQRRGGLNGRPFPMLKFRTMAVGAERRRQELLPANRMNGPVFKLTHDPRVTRMGRFLRRTSLDELPQLVNVVLGHMSLVGPRPLPVEETRALTGSQRRRLSVKPGLTGLWQVSGRNDVSFEKWMELDLWYVDNWSFGLDLAIILRTIPAMLTGRGAY